MARPTSLASIRQRVVVIGGGIVGAAVAAELAAVGGLDVVVVERGPRDRLLGSTAHAPGFVGHTGHVQAVRTAEERIEADR